MTDTVIRWEAPPRPLRPNNRGKWQRFVLQLKERPGEWAVVRETDKQASLGTLQSRLKASGCAAVTRHCEDGLYRLYVRWPA